MSTVPRVVRAHAHPRSALALACVALGLLAWVLFSHPSAAQTVPAPYDCRSADPTKWPPSSKPYFMVALDTSGSMNSTVAGAAPSCAGYPTTRLGHARCALSNMVKAYAGEVNLGLATFPVQMTKLGRQVRVPSNTSANCRSGTQNNGETGIDCGGTCQACTCRDGVMNGTETGVDCGGTCMPCTCSDGVQNGNETAVDCGGSCYSCQCANNTQDGNETGTDCGGPCQACTCGNGVQDGAETGVDCGGQCAPCTCTDGIKNGTETGVDCGGVCQGCSTGVACTSPTDCVSSVCTGGVCGALTCPNNVSGTFGRCVVDNLWTGTCTSTCGNYSGGFGCGGTAQTQGNQRGANVLVPLPADDYWDTPPLVQPNAAALLSWVDNQCGDCKELFSAGNTPLNGILRDMYRYLSTQWKAPAPGTNANQAPGGSPTFGTPLTGTERPCRAVNVILITDGGETCPTDNNAVQAQAAATALRTGWTTGGNTWAAKTYVIDVGGATPAAGSTNIAVAGGTTATAAVNEIAMSQALANIIAGSVTAETCDNTDNNCNTCIDEGSKLYCNRSKTARTLAYLNNVANTKTLADCCQWALPAERTACMTAFTGSINAGNPKGSQWFLPCWDPGAAGGMTAPETKWLCSDPGETCDEADNNCDQQVLTTATAPAALFSTNVVDENQTKCGSPAHCPVAESCDGNDNNCDNITDNAAGNPAPYSICPNSCQPVPEICNGCDDDCDGVADDGLAYVGDGDATDGVGVADLACGFSPPANCAGVKHCGPSAQGVAVAIGGCVAGVTKPGASQYGACTSAPGATDTTCNNIDENCNGVLDEGALPTACTNGLPALVYKDVNPLSTCVKGQQACHTSTCVGWVGPSQEVCDGLDNDCDGLVDAADPDLTGVGAVCGSVQGLCTKGTTSCVGGAVVCTGGTQPQPEVCDGKDNDCDGATDETPLNDGPVASGCWTSAGNVCTFSGAKNTVTWTPPAGATCAALGTLTTPCQAGALVCGGLTGWACQGGQLPSPETCDGLDNNCNGQIDSSDPALTGVGAVCAPPGTVLGSACQGTTQCSGAKLSCTGGASPSPEICDGLDNDCDGLVDAADPDLVGVGSVCGSNQGVCKSGVNACVAGKIVCSGEVKGTAEVCDGLDNNCDGAVDNNITDAPPTPGCWALAGATCTYKNATWSAPAGGTCTGLGTLTTPCAAGTLVCAGTSKWVCQGGTAPSAEVCDGVDNNCNGSADDNNPGGGAQCGTAPSVLPCKKGTVTCTGGQLLCQGEIQPAAEICDSIDNDCDGTVDDNVTTGVGNACGSNSGICKKGVTACVAGAIKCSGGTLPGVEVCNGLDDDCDGTVDNALTDAPPTPGCWQLPGNTCTYKSATWSAPPKATCSGVGTLTTPCAAGTLTCGGTSGWFCQGGVPPQPEACDSKDNDCNGQVDDGNPGGGVSCGSSVGACKAGTQTCTAGVLVCGGGVPPSPEICDGIDNNCDGQIDEPANIIGLGQICGSNVGTCKAGVTVCDATTHKPVCQGEVKASPEICDGKDNDCNGSVDDAPSDAPSDPGCWQKAGNTCSFANVTWSAPAGGTCTKVGSLTSPCAAGTLVCAGASKWACQGGTLPTAEACDNADNNCNGSVDDGNPGGGAQCGTAPSILPCKKGTVTCTSGQLLCQGEIKASPEICDTIDNDCNGVVDDNISAGVGNSCGSNSGICKKGVTACVAGSIQCSGGTSAGIETCNGLDDDCDGVVDNNLSDTPPSPGCWQLPGNTCTFKNVSWSAPPKGTCTGVGTLTTPCKTGALTCGGTGGWFCVGGIPPQPEICDSQDNDCNGQADDGNPGGGVSCGSSVGACQAGTQTCTAGKLVCGGGVSPSPEICDGIDNNCDGQIDEPANIIGLGQICGSNVGTCKAGVTVCDATTHKPVCQGEVKASPEICDGKDNDCNGSVDDTPTDAPSDPGCWQNPGSGCSFANVTWAAPAGGTCTKVGSLTSPCAAGTLVCAGASKWACQGGTLPTAEVCDNADNNCNGSVDDNNPGGGASCGTAPNVAPCKKGTVTCTSGQLLCQGEIRPSAEICDTIDNDCNGAVDDNISAGVGNSCGSNSGICKKGVTACVAGSIQCSGGTLPGTETCNGLDDDCDGIVDNNLSDAPPSPGCWQLPGNTCTFKNVSWSAPAKATCSGVGTLTTPCKTGTLTCGGTTGWFCVGGIPPQPETCDSLDNDCNGQADDGNPGGGVSCGSAVGACKAGTQTCTAGKLVCGGGVSPSPEICDGIDNNCDGQIDEPANIIGLGQICGSNVGTCKAGVMVCDATTHKPVCQGEVKASPEVCDGKDNDCNGSIDDKPTDAPSDPGCWQNPGNTCSFANVSWSAPPGGTCTKVGTLTAPCAAGTLVCAGASKWACQGGTLPSAEVCDNADNNCNGSVDDNNPGGGASCGTAPNVAPCKKGTVTCTSGQLLCQGEIRPTAEICDTIDNDCNGAVDDNISAGVGNSCGSNSGICKKGVTACVAGSIQCSGGTLPGTETCNGLDDDCDGIVDDNLSDAPPSPGCWQLPGSTCTFKNVAWSAPPNATCSDVGTLTTPCKTGTLTCGGTSGWFCVGGVPPQPETCDSKDNDCNGQVDDGNPGGGVSCGSSVGACKAGIQTCTAGTLVCGGGVLPSPEICDGIDNNCDGQIDEPANIIGLGQICGSNVGTCKAGITVCDTVTHKPVCQGEVTASPEVCDGKDNDCNGSIDDKPTDTPADPGCWQNPGSTCTFSTLTWDPPAGATCTKVGALTSPCSAGALICKNGGWECTGGRLPAASEVCDNVDNDCNGKADDGDPGGGATCGKSGVGECRLGTIHCAGGQLLCQGEVPPTAELCDGKDNDCNGVTDDNAPGSGVPCTGQCATGVTACVGGALLCQTTVQSSPEVCNGLDDDCNGLVDDGALGDAPPNPGCWNNPGTTCNFLNVSWDPPPGGSCSDLAPLTAPCQMGRLRCDGGKGWSCIGGKLPGVEICDGQDQNCDGVADDGDPGGGAQCGIQKGTCTFGTQHCVNGQLACNGQGKTAEKCNGLDDDCDGIVDNGLPLGNGCAPAYDATEYPGDRTQGTCSKGKLECDTAGTGQFFCRGGQGPQPEVCNGFDDDCDGKVDEAGPAPDGIDGTADPADKTTSPRHISDACGSDVGECKKGKLACVAGQLQCQGDVRPQPELCDCRDNNCDGKVDEAPGTPAAGQPPAQPLCGTGTACVKDGTQCECAPSCRSGEFPCPTGETCKSLPLSSDPGQSNRYCVSTSTCDCAGKTQPDECGPAGTIDSLGKSVPVCECVGSECHGPCFTRQCGSGSACVPSGDFAGQCRPNTDCRFFPCPSGKACNAGACVDDPCAPNPCKADSPVCKPSPTFDRSRCEKSCANVTCKGTEKCADGVCVPTGCATACASGKLCLPVGTDGGGACGPSPCVTTTGEPACNDGSYCDPLTGACGNDPCQAVKCPSGQACAAGECIIPPSTGTGGAGGTSGGGAAGAAGTAGSDTGGTGSGTTDGGGNATGAGGRAGGGTAGSGPAEPPSNEALGLATGGGGCRCDLPARGSSSSSALAFGALVVTVLTTRRRARREGGAR